MICPVTPGDRREEAVPGLEAGLRELDAGELDLVVFDLDGVVLDSFDAVTNSMAYALEAHGFPAPDPTELRHFIGPPTFTSFAELTGQPADSDVVVETVATYRARYESVFLEQTSLFAGIEEALNSLASVLALAVATSKSIVFAEPLLDALGIAGLFRFVAAPAAEAYAEDKTATLGRALAALAPGRGAMVGDRRFDVEAAHTHGLLAIGVTWGIGSTEELLAAGADALVDAPGELAPLLLGAGPRRQLRTR
jgi:phosphoglycolate phosphatase